MKSFFFKLFLLITALFLGNDDLVAQVNWTKYPGNPIITGGPSGSWHYQLFEPRVLYNTDLSRYEMWFCASDKSSAGSSLFRPWQIGFAYSADGTSWTVHPTPVLTPTPGQWDAVAIEEPCVILENGQYKMWYAGGSTVDPPTPVAIGYATSPDGINWTKHSGPVMTAGSSSWEAGGVCSGFVIPYEGGYKMYYSGWDVAANKEHIGYATSVDGINWVKYQNNPVLLAGTNGQWDDMWVAFPSILYIENIYYMWYMGVGGYFTNLRVGLATSFDGINWIKHPDNPVLKPTPGQWDGNELESASVLLIGDTLWAWYDGSDGSRWKIGLAKSLYTPLPLPPGTYTVGTGGNFATIQDAFNKLETDGVAGNVTLELIDELYTAPTTQFGFLLNGPIPGAGPNSRVTIKPAENKNVVIQGNGYAVLSFINTSYLTFDGVSITGSTSISIHALYNNQFQWNNGLLFLDDSDHNIIQNCIFIDEDILRLSVGLGIYTDSNIPEASDSNLIQFNYVKQAGIGIYVSSYRSTVRATGNIIRANIIGSETDSLISWGIQVERNHNAIIEDNVIESIRGASSAFIITHGINCYACLESTIRNNIVHNVYTSYTGGSMGIALTGDGNGNTIYNNMIYDINSSSSASQSNIGGIHLESQNNTKIYYNSVYLYGAGANQQGSGALYIWTPGNNTEVKNNIFINTRDEGQFCASAIHLKTLNTILSSSDFNVLYYEPNNYNSLVKSNTGSYHSLTEWQATGYDLHSHVEMPHFMSSTDLHIDETIPTYLESRGTPIAGITVDFDGQTRHAATPDIGADEFDGVVGVEDEETIPTEFALEQNYPNPFNPSTVISYQLPVSGNVTLKVYDILGNEIATLVDENNSAGRYEVEFNAASLPSGVYFYQLTSGDFVNTKKMILLK